MFGIHYKVFIVPVITIWKIKRKFLKVKNTLWEIYWKKTIVLDNRSISKQLKGKTILVTGAAGVHWKWNSKAGIGFNPGIIIILDQAETPLPCYFRDGKYCFKF
jgi:FlaA1/EpsC-like NDP-sugar epimerase